ncbi:sporulation protein YjcZ [Chengkuizengella marina]|nr:sporulation protein YjcZ [Chengkuizengella marina]
MSAYGGRGFGGLFGIVLVLFILIAIILAAGIFI